MTAFTTADLPASVNTVEKLHAWASAVLLNLNPQTEVQEAPGITEKVAVHQVFPVYLNGQWQYRVISRMSARVDGDYLQGSAKFWTYVQEISNAAIPSNFKS